MKKSVEVSSIPLLQLIDGFATAEKPGGAALFAIQLARHLDRTRYKPYICGLWRYDTESEHQWLNQLADEGIEAKILIERPTNLMHDLLQATHRVIDIIRQNRIAIVHSHFERCDLLALQAKMLTPQHPYIVRTVHGERNWLTRPWLGYLLNLAVYPSLFDAETAVSLAVKRILDNRLGSRLWHRQAHLIYNGISQDYIERVAPLRQSPRGPLRRIAIIGRLHPQKGHGFFLEAASLLYKTNPDLEFWIVGTGELRDELENLTDLLGISSAVQFLGTRTDIANILAQVDVLVSSSVWEGFPTVLMEAMAARVPVVATDVSGSRELVTSGKTGILVPPADPTALASAISWLYSHPQEAKVMTENAWQSVRQYGFDCIATKMAQLYHSLMVDSSGDEPNF